MPFPSSLRDKEWRSQSLYCKGRGDSCSKSVVLWNTGDYSLKFGLNKSAENNGVIVSSPLYQLLKHCLGMGIVYIV